MYGRGPPPGYGSPFSAPSGPGGYGGGANSIPTGPRGGSHAGLGAPGAPSSLPRPPNLPQTPSFAMQPPAGFVPPAGGAMGGPVGGWQGEKFSLFVGNIVDGVENGWLERLLGVAGNVLSFRRPTPAFAFVEYAEPEAVLRCLEVVNGVMLKTPAGAEKALLVKADEKTRARLDEYEKTRVKSEVNDDLTEQAKEDTKNIQDRIAAGDPISASLTAPEPEEPAPIRSGPKIPQHLKDLAPEDLPENQRSNTLSEISKFRERAVKKAIDKHQLNQQIEDRRRAMIEENLRRERAAQQAQMQGKQGSPAGASPGQDPQSLNRPVGFVQGQNGQTPDGELDDIKRERERAEREARQQEAIFRDRERRFEARERGRLQAWEREAARERNVAEQEERDRAFMAERLATWDDDREAERGRESFYIDRVRWRAQRKPLRAREAEADARDRAAEAQHLASIEQQSDSFLSQHADLLASSLPTAPAGDSAAAADAPAPASADAGAAASPAPPASTSTPQPVGGVKLSISAASKPSTVEVPRARPTALALEDEEEEGRRKRELIPLSYSDDEGEASAAKKAAKAVEQRLSRGDVHKQQREIEDRVPSDKDGLWAWKVRWEVLGQDIIKSKVLPFANQLIVKYLGGEEAELLNAVDEHLREHKSAQELLDELEPVLDEDVTDFVVKVWRQLAVETELRHAGVDL
ncbi:hypothetical protein JCM10213_000384 [Rhodosporidiobolus nylandii]